MISNYIENLTSQWLLWMENHQASNDSQRSFSERRVAGEKCEEVQRERQKLILDMDKLFDE